MLISTNTANIQQSIQLDIAESKLRSLKLKRWLKTEELALYLGSTKEAIKKLHQRKRIEAVKFCGRLYFDRERIDLLIENSLVDMNRMIKTKQELFIPKPRGR